MLSVVIPALNEEEAIEGALRRLREVLKMAGLGDSEIRHSSDGWPRSPSGRAERLRQHAGVEGHVTAPGNSVDTSTIGDFGEQWTHFRDNRGYYSSVECLDDVFGPLLDIKEIRGLTVGDIGSGTGRVVNMLLDAGARRVVAVEPSAAFAALERNTAAQRDKVTLVNDTGEAIANYGPLDLVVSIGVLHHILEPEPVVKAALAALRPGGLFVGWLYGREGNGLYLALAIPVRAITTRLPHRVLVMLSGCLAAAARLYGQLCRWIPLPLAQYMKQHFLRLDREQRVLTVYDQLNPAYAKYYRRGEAESLLKEAGFSDVRVYNRHRYSWTVIGRKPGSDGSRISDHVGVGSGAQKTSAASAGL